MRIGLDNYGGPEFPSWLFVIRTMGVSGALVRGTGTEAGRSHVQGQEAADVSVQGDKELSFPVSQMSIAVTNAWDNQLIKRKRPF